MTTEAKTASAIVEEWLAQVLKGDATLSAMVGGRIFSTVAPQGSTYELLLFAALGGNDVNALGPFRTLSEFRYSVSAIVDKPSVVTLDPIMFMVDQLLHGKHAVLANGYVLGGQRTTPPMVTGVPDYGINFRRMMATYQFYVQEGHG